MSGWHLEEIQKSHTSQGRSQATLAFQCFRRPVGQKAGWLFLNWQNWMKREKNWIPLISWGPFQLQDATKEHSICTYICPCFFIKTYMDVWLYINVYCIHTSKHKALEVRTAEEMQKSMSCFAALAGTHRCHWQIWVSPLGLLPLQSVLTPTGTTCVAVSLAKPQTRTADSFLLVPPVTSIPDPSIPDPGRQARTKEMKRKAQTLCPDTQLCQSLVSGREAFFPSSPSP